MANMAIIWFWACWSVIGAMQVMIMHNSSNGLVRVLVGFYVRYAWLIGGIIGSIWTAVEIAALIF